MSPSDALGPPGKKTAVVVVGGKGHELWLSFILLSPGLEKQVLP